jgi:hypothetical protein
MQRNTPRVASQFAIPFPRQDRQSQCEGGGARKSIRLCAPPHQPAATQKTSRILRRTMPAALSALAPGRESLISILFLQRMCTEVC